MPSIEINVNGKVQTFVYSAYGAAMSDYWHNELLCGRVENAEQKLQEWCRTHVHLKIQDENEGIQH